MDMKMIKKCVSMILMVSFFVVLTTTLKLPRLALVTGSRAISLILVADIVDAIFFNHGCASPVLSAINSVRLCLGTLADIQLNLISCKDSNTGAGYIIKVRFGDHLGKGYQHLNIYNTKYTTRMIIDFMIRFQLHPTVLDGNKMIL
ncbi:uncharacterized protein [Spinacia oleracea]|uniref:Uncharacterized protein n=1 Tax=Spinacia oleracea TaxID=3562 RepID=A0ABM3R188_SPIOL|nr:uncharacterized protein LOC130464016 [Spinacia oleracea]